MNLDQIVDLDKHPIAEGAFRDTCRDSLDGCGALVLHNFLSPEAIAAVNREGVDKRHKAFFCEQTHNAYLGPTNPDFALNHPRNRAVVSSKGCICDDDIAEHSPLRGLYDSADFQGFLCHVLGEQALYRYADPLSSINLNYAEQGQELGWHFDNSSFAITLMIQSPEAGGSFDYITNLRNSSEGEMNYDGVGEVLDGNAGFETMSLGSGDLALFRGRDSLHRVTPVIGDTTRILVVLAYNTAADISLSESARMSFFGRLD